MPTQAHHHRARGRAPRLAIAVLGLLAAVAAGTGAVAAQTGTASTLPGGTSIDVEITSAPRYLPAREPLVVSGTASVGAGEAVKDTSLALVLDTSGSTRNDAGIDCDDDDTTTDSILDCERAAVRQLAGEAAGPSSPIKNLGIATFPALDEPSLLGLTDPTNTTAIEEYLERLSPAGGTPFDVGINGARTIFEDAEVADRRVIVLLTDGDGTLASDTRAVDAEIRAFAIAGTGCDDQGLLDAVALGTNPGSDCTVVSGSLDQLSTVIGEAIGSTLDSVGVTVDETALATTTDVALPENGPVTTGFSAGPPVGNLAPGAYTICATATGTDAGGSGSVSDCAPLDVVDEAVDCAEPGTCEATIEDPGVATLEFTAPEGFQKEVGLRVGLDNDCFGTECRASFDVLFDDTDPSLATPATIQVTTADRVPLREALRAAVFIDGVQVRDWCGPLDPRIRRFLGLDDPPLPCADIRYTSGLRLQYTVIFDADPGFRFR